MQPRKQHLIDTALTLFNQYGYHATGIDLILAQSKVSKATLYKHFRSKEELILAVLQQRHEQVLTGLKNKIYNKIDNKNQRDEPDVLAIFDSLDEWFSDELFFGCNFINATAEYADASHPINIFSALHKQSVVDLMKEILLKKEINNADDVANQLDLLIEGAIVMAHTRGMKEAALIAKGIAQRLIVMD